MKLHWLYKVVVKYKQPVTQKYGSYTLKYRKTKYYVSKGGIKSMVELLKKDGVIKKVYILH